MAFLEITQMIQSTQEVLKRTLSTTFWRQGPSVVQRSHISLADVGRQGDAERPEDGKRREPSTVIVLADASE
jgi:hypothetical protein